MLTQFTDDAMPNSKRQSESWPSPCESDLSRAGTPTSAGSSERSGVGYPDANVERADAEHADPGHVPAADGLGCDCFDIIIVGTGPHGLSMLSALHEPNSRDVLSEKEFNRKHLRQARSGTST